MKQMLANAPRALSYILDAIRRGVDAPPSSLYDLEAANFASLADTDDAREGTAAFLGKRAPRFNGR